MVAARYRGNAEVVHVLLKQGAKANADKNVKVLNNASALVFASFSGDVDTARALIDAGAAVEHRMMVLGLLPMTPLMGATLRGDNEMAALLIERQADPNVGDLGTPLGRAIVNNQAETVKLLRPRGNNRQSRRPARHDAAALRGVNPLRRPRGRGRTARRRRQP